MWKVVCVALSLASAVAGRACVDESGRELIACKWPMPSYFLHPDDPDGLNHMSMILWAADHDKAMVYRHCGRDPVTLKDAVDMVETLQECGGLGMSLDDEKCEKAMEASQKSIHRRHGITEDDPAVLEKMQSYTMCLFSKYFFRRVLLDAGWANISSNSKHQKLNF